MSDTIQTITERLVEMFQATDQILNSWEGDGNLQFPNLMSMVALKMNWNEKQVKESDPLIRYYVRNNPEWHVTRGAHGGIMRAADRQKKQQVQAEKAALKLQMKAQIEGKQSAPAPAPAPTPENEIFDDDDQEQDI